MLQENIKLGYQKFNLKASFIGDPYIAPLIQRTHMHVVPEALNILDDSNMPQISALRHRCMESLAKDMVNAKYDCKKIMGFI